MSYKKNGSRPLGKLPSPTRDLFADGMIVSSMAVPPLKPANTALKKPIINDVKPVSPELSNAKHKLTIEGLEKQLRDKDKLLKEREREIRESAAAIKSAKQQLSTSQGDAENLKERIRKLEKECSSLKTEVFEKGKTIVRLETQLDAQKSEIDYRKLYEAELASHKETSAKLNAVTSDLNKLRAEMDEAEKRNKAKIDALTVQMEERLNTVIKEKDEQIKEREEKVQKMKKQMAEAFTGSSVERQQQIDELNKELGKVQTECDSLRLKLRQSLNSDASKSGSCRNCINLKAHLEKKDQFLKDRDRKIEELENLCKRFGSQLKQQEQLISEWKQSHDRTAILRK